MRSSVIYTLLSACALPAAIARPGQPTIHVAKSNDSVSLLGPAPRYPIHPDTAPHCIFYYDNVDGRISCENVPTLWRLTEAEWKSWNPVLEDSCDAFTPETSWCVEVGDEPEPEPSTTTAAPPPSTTTAGNGVITPEPTQPGMVDDCDSFHLVERGDSCETIAAQNGIEVSDLLDWNTDIGGTACTGLWRDAYVCVSIIGHEPTPTDPGNGIETPQPIQPGMVKDCDAFHLVESGENCESIAKDNGISVSEFTKWNPEVGGSQCSGLWLDVHVCVSVVGHEPTPTDPGNGIETPTPIQDGMVGNCDKFHFIKKGENCDAVVKQHGITIKQFTDWNKAAGSQCTGLWAETYACVSIVGHTPTPTDPGNGVKTPTPIQDGMTKNCNRFHLVRKGQTCQTIASQYKVTVQQIRNWNPAVKSDCSGIWADTHMCVGVL